MYYQLFNKSFATIIIVLACLFSSVGVDALIEDRFPPLSKFERIQVRKTLEQALQASSDRINAAARSMLSTVNPIANITGRAAVNNHRVVGTLVFKFAVSEKMRCPSVRKAVYKVVNKKFITSQDLMWLNYLIEMEDSYPVEG
jgi:hypothetical protein